MVTDALVGLEEPERSQETITDDRRNDCPLCAWTTNNDIAKLVVFRDWQALFHFASCGVNIMIVCHNRFLACVQLGRLG